MSAKRILLVEDDASIRRGVIDALEFSGYEVLHAATGDEGMSQAIKRNFDLLLIDLVLPGKSGFEILKATRQSKPTISIIILTARGDESDRVQGLRLGADDYMVKPFSMRELLARVEAVLRRSPARPHTLEKFSIRNAAVNLARSEVCFKNGSRSQLSEREVDLLRYLAANPGRVISRDEILNHVWRLSSKGVETRTIDMHVANLREKLRDDSENPSILLTVRGKGYMFAGAKP
jgi:DNA-binding response OmpR family regulator